MSGPLDGVRVLEFGHWIAGPFASAILGDLGADVVKVEPLTGDALRGNNAAPFMAANRGKRSVAVDIKTPEGTQVIETATRWADVVMHNFRPGVDKRLGIDAETLRRRKPEIVVLQSSAYGIEGPKSTLPGFDSMLQGFAGHFVQAGGTPERPIAYRFSHVDYATGMLGALAVVASLYRKRRTGAGTWANVNLLNTAVFMLGQLERQPDGQFTGLPAVTRDLTGFGPSESLYQASDGWLAVVALDEAVARSLVKALDLGDAISSSRREWTGNEHGMIAAAISQRSVADTVKLLRAAGVWAEPVQANPIAALTSDPAMREAGTAFVADDAATGVRRSQVGRIATFGSGVNELDATRAQIPELGEHTRAFLGELGYDTGAIDGLYEAGIVG